MVQPPTRQPASWRRVARIDAGPLFLVVYHCLRAGRTVVILGARLSTGGGFACPSSPDVATFLQRRTEMTRVLIAAAVAAGLGVYIVHAGEPGPVVRSPAERATDFRPTAASGNMPSSRAGTTTESSPAAVLAEKATPATSCSPTARAESPVAVEPVPVVPEQDGDAGTPGWCFV